MHWTISPLYSPFKITSAQSVKLNECIQWFKDGEHNLSIIVEWILLQTLIESLASIHNIIPGSAGNIFNYGVKHLGVRRLRAFCPASCYCHASQQTAVYTLKLTHFIMMTFMSMLILLRSSSGKGFPIKTAVSFLLTFGFQRCSRHIPQVMTLLTFQYINLFLEQGHLWL